jgi:hypothetical protein
LRKIQKAAVVAAMLGSIGFVGAGTASAGGSDLDVTQSNACKSHDLNISLLNNIGVLNGLLGNAASGEGNPGAQEFEQGSDLTCSNAVGN